MSLARRRILLAMEPEVLIENLTWTDVEARLAAGHRRAVICAASSEQHGPHLPEATDYLLGRVENPGMAEAGDPLYREVGKLSDRDREIAKDFLKMLARRQAEKNKKGNK